MHLLNTYIRILKKVQEGLTKGLTWDATMGLSRGKAI